MVFLGILIAILALAPLPFGSAPPFWQTGLASLSLLAVTAAALARQPGISWPPTGMRPVGWSGILFAIVIVWSLIQALVPGPWAHPAWQQAEALLGGPTAGTISLDPFTTLADTLSLLGIGGVFLLALGVSRTAGHARLLLRAIAVIGFIYALYGLVIYLSGNTMVAWAPKRHYEGVLTSTFVNRNSFGVFAGLGILAGTAILTSTLTALLSGESRMRERMRLLLEGTVSRYWVWAVGAIACAMALLLTGSRGASAATLLATIVLIFIYLSARRTSPGVLIGYVTGIAILATLLLGISGDFLLDRLGDKLEHDAAGRGDIYALALGTLSDHAWLGAGYGAFEDAFAIYETGLGPLSPRYVYAHNVYLELATELGIPVALLLFASIGLLVGICIRGVATRRRDRIYPSIAVAATLLVGLQGVFDFGIQTPAIATLYAAILGMGVAQSVSSRG